MAGRETLPWEKLDPRKIFASFGVNRKVSLSNLLYAWFRRDDHQLDFGIETYAALARHFLGAGEIRVALDVAQTTLNRLDPDCGSKGFEPLKFDKGHSEQIRARILLMHCCALSLARLGYLKRAQVETDTLSDFWNSNKMFLEDYQKTQSLEIEILGLEGRLYKDIYVKKRSDDLTNAKEFLKRAQSRYQQASELGGDTGFWPAVNAGFAAFLLNDNAYANAIAGKALVLCEKSLESQKQKSERGELDFSDDDHYWHLATIAEAQLIADLTKKSVGDPLALAKQKYQNAAKIGCGQWSNLQTTRRQLGLILAHFYESDGKSLATSDCQTNIDEWIDEVLPLPPVLLFSGHMVDTKERLKTKPHRFPREIVDDIKREILKTIREVCPRGPCYGFASCANGADILFHEALQELKGESHVVLPYNHVDFIKDSVNLEPNDSWEKRFLAVMTNAGHVISATKHRLTWRSQAYDYANSMLCGLALIKARELGMKLVPIAVYDGNSGDGAGGTADNVESWKKGGLCPRIIDINIIRHQSFRGAEWSPSVAEDSYPKVPATPSYQAGVKGLLFADVKGFSKLSDEQLETFIDQFWYAIGEYVNNSEFKPIMQNTWGDELYLVFDSVRNAGMFALGLKEIVRSIDRVEHGLPGDLTLRIALHAGPVYEQKNDVLINGKNFFGSHVNYAARLEPVTEPGQVFTTDAFAALAEVEQKAGRDLDFSCEYVGRVALPKNHGICETYRLKRS